MKSKVKVSFKNKNLITEPGLNQGSSSPQICYFFPQLIIKDYSMEYKELKT